MGPPPGPEDRLQPDLLRPSQGRLRIHPEQPRERHAQVLGRPRQVLPQDRRLDRPRTAGPLSPQPLDPRRVEGRPDGPLGGPGGAPQVARGDLRGRVQPPADEGLAREQALRHRQRVVRRRLARVLPRLRPDPGEDHLPRPRPLPPDRVRRRQALGHPAVLRARSSSTSAAASAGTATTSSCSTTRSAIWPPRSSAARPSTGSTSPSTISTPASTGSGPGSWGPGPCSRGSSSRFSSPRTSSGSSTPAPRRSPASPSSRSSRPCRSAPVWDYYCLRQGVPPADEWLREVDAYERRVLSRR